MLKNQNLKDVVYELNTSFSAISNGRWAIKTHLLGMFKKMQLFFEQLLTIKTVFNRHNGTFLLLVSPLRQSNTNATIAK